MRSVAARVSVVLVLAFIAAPLGSVAADEEVIDRFVNVTHAGFNPQIMGVDAGMRLQWKNIGSSFHEVHCNYPGSCTFQSQPLYTNETFTITVQGPVAQLPLTLYYVCRYHILTGKLYVGTNLNATQDLAPLSSSFYTSRPFLAPGVRDYAHAQTTAIIRNLGENTSASATVEVRDVDNEVLAKTTLAPLEGGEERLVSLTWVAHPLWSGRVKLLVDPYNSVLEGHEGNNVVAADVELAPLTASSLP